MNKPDNFIQWKNTDVCMDFWCDCGNQMHLDGYFAYNVFCKECKTFWKMGQSVSMTKISKENFNINDAYITEQSEEDFDGLINIIKKDGEK